MAGRRSALLLALVIAAATCSGVAAQSALRYEDLTPLADVVNIRAIWRALKLPELPPTFCHVGLLGWHCHNTTLQPWDPRSLIPKEQLPPMPANASCIICPNGWSGSRRNLMDVLLDIPLVQASHRLPQGFYDMHVLQLQQQSSSVLSPLAAAHTQAPP